MVPIQRKTMIGQILFSVMLVFVMVADGVRSDATTEEWRETPAGSSQVSAGGTLTVTSVPLPPSPASTVQTWSDSVYVSVLRIWPDRVLLQWHCSQSVRQRLITCQARYGLLTPENARQDDENGRWWRFEQTQVDVVDEFIPDLQTFVIPGLKPNASYVFALLCRDLYGILFTSNRIFFTTSLLMASEASPYQDSAHSQMAEPNYRSSGIAFPSDLDQRLTESLSWTKSPRYKYASYTIILGVVCGVVGFVIINVTLVMAIRKYSHWRIRRNRLRQLRYIYGDDNHYYDVS